MEANEATNADYQQGFNEGYTISEHMPLLGEQLSRALSGTMRSEGFHAGRNQFLTDKIRERYPSWLQKDRLASLDKGEPTRDKDKDDLDYER